MKLRDIFWLWGHPEGRYNHEYGNELESRMTPMEACLYLGIRNTFMVPVGRDINRRQYNKSFTTLRQVGWDLTKNIREPGVIDTFLEEVKEFPNIGCVVFDDYKYLHMKQRDALEGAAQDDVHERLHNNPVRRLDTWMVLYLHEFGEDPAADAAFLPHIAPFDGIIMWNWRESDYKKIPEKFEIFKKMTPNNRRMFGCYLWNFGERKEATAEAVTWQLDFYREKILAGEAEGVVLHTNTMADLDYEAYDAAIRWMELHGDEEIPDDIVGRK